MPAEVRVAIVGADAEAYWWEHQLQAAQDARVVATPAPAMKSSLGPQEQWQRAVRDPDVDAVLVCVPIERRADIAMPALESGKHVLVPPPMAGDWESAQRMAEAARRSGVLLRAALPDCHRLAIARIHTWIAEGTIGDPLILRCRLGGTMRRASAPVPTDAVDTLMAHAIGLARWLLGSFESAVSLDLPTAGTATAIFRSGAGRAALVQVSLADEPGEFLVEVAGRDGYVSARGDGEGRERAVFGPRDTAAPFRETVLEYLDPRTSGVREWEEFVGAIRSDNRGDGTLDALQSMRVFLAARRSARTGTAEVI